MTLHPIIQQEEVQETTRAKRVGSRNQPNGRSSKCYELRLKVLSDRTTLVLSNTRELDRVPKTKYSTLYTITHGPC